MTLHEAIEKVLKQQGRPMTAREIADDINVQKLYQRGDGNPIPSSQINARAHRYPTLFEKKNNKIWIYKSNIISNAKDDIEAIVLNLFQRLYDLTINSIIHQSSLFKLISFSEIVISLKVIANESLFNKELRSLVDGSDFLSAIELVNQTEKYRSKFETVCAFGDVIRNQDILQLIKELYRFIIAFSTDRLNRLLKDFIEEPFRFQILKPFYRRTPYFVRDLMVSLTNPSNGELVYDPAAGSCSVLHSAFEIDKSLKLVAQEIVPEIARTGNLKLLLSNAVDYRIINSNFLLEPAIGEDVADVILSDLPVGLFKDKPINQKYSKLYSGKRLEGLFLELILSRVKKKTGRAAVLLPSTFLRKSIFFKIRKYIIDNDILEAIIEIPKYYLENLIKDDVVLLLINFAKYEAKKNNIIFIEAALPGKAIPLADKDKKSIKPFSPETSREDLEILVRVVSDVKDHFDLSNNPIDNSGGSEIISVNTIKNHNYDLTFDMFYSGLYKDLDRISRKENFKSLGDMILTPSKQTTSVLEKNELKFVHIKNLNDGDTEFYLKQNKLEYAKETSKNYKIFNKSVLLIARVGDKIKPTYFEYRGEPIAISNNIFTFEVKLDEISIEYLIVQLRSDLIKKQLHLIYKKTGIPSFNKSDFLKIKIPVPDFSVQFSRLSVYKEDQFNKFRLTNFIQDIHLVANAEDIKKEIERFTLKVFPDSEHVIFRTEFESRDFPFSKMDIDETKYIKATTDGHYKHLLLLKPNKEIYGVLTVQSDSEVSSETYSEINAYTNFISETSLKFIQQNTNKLLADFSHTTTNILKNIKILLHGVVSSGNNKLITALRENYVKDEKEIKFLIEKKGGREEDFLADNRLKEALNILQEHRKFFKRRHEYFTKSAISVVKNVELKTFIDQIFKNKSWVNLEAEYIKGDEVLRIKSAPIELAFEDILENAKSYSKDGKAKVEIFPRQRFIEFIISNRVIDKIPVENYNILGKEDIKKADGTYSTGLKNAFAIINEQNKITLASYVDHFVTKTFEVIIKLKRI